MGVEILKVGEDRVASAQRGCTGVNGVRVFGGTRSSEEVGPDALGQDEVVVGDRVAVVDLDNPVLGIDTGHTSATEVGVRTVVSGEGAKSVGDIARVETAGCHLIQQRLECGVRVAVDEGDVASCLGSLFGSSQAAESGADDDNSGLGVRQNRFAAQARQADV